MNMKYLIMISLILTILTLNAVSASDDVNGDNLTITEEIEVEYPTDNIELTNEEHNLEKQNEDVLKTSEENELTKESEKETHIEPSKLNITTDIKNEYSKHYPYSREITVNVSENLENLPEQIQIYIDNEFESYLYNSQHYLNTNSLDLGKHQITFYYKGDDTYQELNRTYEFEIVDVEIIIPTKYIEDYDNINIYLPNDAEGTLTINVNEKQYLKNNINELGYINYNYREISEILNNIAFETLPVEVIYSGDSKYSPASKKVNVTFEYKINIDINEYYQYTTNQEIYINLPNDIENKPIVKIDDIEYYLSNTEYEFYNIHLKINNLTIGKHNISVTYKDNKYPLKTASAEFKIIPSLNVDTIIPYEKTGIINLTSAKGNEGVLNVTYKLKDSDEYIPYDYVNLIDGMAIIEIKDLNVGQYDFNIKYVGEYQNEMESFRNYVINIIPNIEIPSKLLSNENSEIKVTTNEEYNEPIIIYISTTDDDGFYSEENKEIFGQIDLNNGIGKLPLSLQKGDYCFLIKTDDEYDNYRTYYTSVRDIPHDAMEFTVSIPKEFLKSYSGEGPFVNIKVPEDANGYVDIYVDGNYYTKVEHYELEYFELGLHELSKGTHTVEFKYHGDTYYDDVNKTYEIKVADVTIYIPDEIIINYDNQIHVNTPTNAKGSISVYVDGKLFKKLSYNDYYDGEDYNIYSIDLSSLKIKQHEIEVKFSGDSKYAAVSKKVTVNMSYLIDIIIDGEYIYGYNINNGNTGISIILPSDIKSKPVVKIDNTNYNLANIKDLSEFTLDISKLSIGSHNLYVSYSDNKYPFKEVNTTFIIKPEIIYDPTIYYGDSSEITLKLPSNATGNLTVYKTENYFEAYDENDLYITTTLKNGFASIKLDNLRVGKHYLHIIYTGEDYVVQPINSEFEVNINIKHPSTMNYGENKYLTIKSDDSDSRTIKIYANGKYYGKIQLVKGIGKISLNKMPIGEEIEIEGYINEEDYLFSRTLNVYPIKTKLTGGKNIKMYYYDGSSYSIKVFGDYGKAVGKGKTVTFKIGTKIFKVKTNTKGVASLKITNLPGKYTITASYNGIKVSNKITVKQVLTLKTVKVKKSAKKLILKATLKNGKKAIKNKKIIFKFKGKKYTAKTNKKGVATVTIQKSVLKKLKVGKKVTYQATYMKNTVKKTVKIKK